MFSKRSSKYSIRINIGISISVSHKVKLRASTLIESIIAMIIIMLVFGMSIQVFLSKGGLGSNHQKTEAVILGERICQKSLSGVLLTEDDMKTESLTATRIIEPFKDDSTGLFLMTITVYDNDSVPLFQKKELINTDVSAAK